MRILVLSIAVIIPQISFCQLQDSVSLFSPDGKYAIVYDYNHSLMYDLSLWNIYSSDKQDTVMTILKKDELYFEIDFPYREILSDYSKTRLLNINEVLKKFKLTSIGHEISSEIRYSIKSVPHFTTDSIHPNNHFDVTYYWKHNNTLLDSITLEFFCADSADNMIFERLRPIKSFDSETGDYRGIRPSTGFALISEEGHYFLTTTAYTHFYSEFIPELKVNEVGSGWMSSARFEEPVIIFKTTNY